MYHHLNLNIATSVQLSPEQLAPFGSTSQLLVDESISSTVATIDSSANRDDFTATAKISECTIPSGLTILCNTMAEFIISV